jgi:hypothetical protein
VVGGQAVRPGMTQTNLQPCAWCGDASEGQVVMSVSSNGVSTLMARRDDEP